MQDIDFKRLICLSTIQDRKYTEKLEGRFRPTELGVVVSDLLVERFAELMDYNFTAKMENNLDKIEEGGLKWVDIVMDFYKPFDKDLAEAMENLGKVKPKDIPTKVVRILSRAVLSGFRVGEATA